ncbi:MAG: c-type cytochrome, partial [Planctomycetota bacterium]|nr:c-type cytochrome [Planctomycetota bacterium]
EIWRAARDSESRFVQKAAVVALRKLKSPRLKSYVDGSAISSIDNEVLLEAVRAVHDLPLIQFFPQIAALANRTGYPDAVTRRALNAAYRLGTPQHAQAIAALAAKPTAAPAMRLEALDMLKSWAKPSNRDRVLGDWRPLASRPREAAATALRGNLVAILGGNTKITQSAIDAAAGLGIREIEPVIRKRFADTKGSASTRANALRAMEALNSDMLDRTAIDALNDEQELVRIAARDVLSRVNPPVALESLGGATASTSLAERQQAFASLGRMSPQQAGRLLEQAMRDLKQGKVPRDTRLDVVEAARKIGSQPLRRLLAEYDKATSGEQGLAGYTDCLQGGNSAAGRKIFFEKAAVYCVRCHQVAGRGGNVGPDLSRIATEKDRRYLLEAIVQPNAAIARNYETVLLATDDGLSYSGILKEESETELVLLNAEGKTVRIPKETIEQRGKGKSSMPADLINNLSKMEVRDLVEFLSSLKE